MRRIVCYLMLLMSFSLVLASCGGGGGGGGASTTTLTGMITFPESVSSSKALGKIVSADGSNGSDNVSIEVYDLSGNKIKTVIPTYDDTVPAATRTYDYQIQDLPPGVDYVLKAVKGAQVVKKIIPKENAIIGTVAAQNVDPVSTAAVVVAEQKLQSVIGSAISLGETPLPPTVQIATVSSALATSVKPAVLETQILTLSLANNNSIDTQAKADLINVLNMVTEAIKNNLDAGAFVKGDVASTQITVNVFVVTGGVVSTETKTISSEDAKTTTSDAASSYVPPTTGASATEYIAIAIGYLNKQDVANASINYEKALAADPNDKNAIFGAAITRVIMLVEDPDVRDVITKWGGVAPTANEVISSTSPIGNPFSNYTGILGKATSSTTLKTTAKITAPGAAQATAVQVVSSFKSLLAKLPQVKPATKSNPKVLSSIPTTATSIAELQVVVDNKIIPKLQSALSLLASLEGKGYAFTVTKAMQGNPVYGTDITISDGEIYAVEAIAHGALALLKLSTAYNLDVYDYDGNGKKNDYDAIELDPLKTINQTSFFTLKSDGRTKMSAALENLKTARDKAESGYNLVKTRASGQGAFDMSGWDSTDHANTVKVLADVKTALNGTYTLAIDNGTRSVILDAAKFFTNPLDRTDFPTLGYDVAPNATLSLKYDRAVAAERVAQEWYWNGTTWLYGDITVPVLSEIEPLSDLPDYTLNGILPNNTPSNNVEGFNGILPLIEGKLLSDTRIAYYQSVTTDGTYLYGVAYQGNDKVIKRINPATGEVTTLGGGDSIERLIYYNNTLHGFGYNASNNGVFGPLVLANGTYTIYEAQGEAVEQLPWNIATNGTDFFFDDLDWSTYPYTTSIKKRDSSGNFIELFKIPDYVYFLGYWNGNLYINNEKYDMTGNVLYSYANMNGLVIMNGYFYDMWDGKVLKYAGKPDGTAAKVLSNLF